MVRDDLEAAEPTGTDSYILLASAEQITGYDNAFNQAGVRGLEQPANEEPLLKILNMGSDSNTRGVKNTSSTNWTLKKLFIITRH